MSWMSRRGRREKWRRKMRRQLRREGRWGAW